MLTLQNTLSSLSRCHRGTTSSLPAIARQELKKQNGGAGSGRSEQQFPHWSISSSSHHPLEQRQQQPKFDTSNGTSPVPEAAAEPRISRQMHDVDENSHADGDGLQEAGLMEGGMYEHLSYEEQLMVLKQMLTPGESVRAVGSVRCLHVCKLSLSHRTAMICMRIFAYPHVNVFCGETTIRTRTHAHTHTKLHTHTHTHTHIHTHTYTHAHVYTHTHTHEHTYRHTHIQTRTHIDTHI